MRVVAILATYNEERFIAPCIESLAAHGILTYLIDNCSTDRTVAIAERYLNRGIIGIETFARSGVFSLREQLRRKEGLAAELEADWFLHVDADEVRLPPDSKHTLAEGLAQAEAEGYNAVNFTEYVFVPTRECPDHDHPNFRETMRWYYPFEPVFPHRLNAWKKQDGPVELTWSGGHRVRFPSLKIYPRSFKMRHYLFLSVPHLIEKYVNKRFAADEVADGWHGWRRSLDPELIRLPSCTELRTYTGDDALDASNPRRQHYMEQWARP